MININQRIIQYLNAYSCLAICVVLAVAQLMQFLLHELPCPLCLLQRVGFIGMAAGFFLNAYDKPRQMHYLITIVSAILTLSVGLRQVLLHIAPNTGVYGSAFLGLHLYTWSVILASAVLFWIIGLLLVSSQQFTKDETPSEKKCLFFNLIFGLFMLLILMNSITTFAICGLDVCPSDPTHYLWLVEMKA